MTDDVDSSASDRTESLLALLDDVRRVVETARSMPMSSSALVNRAEVLDLVAAAREAVPDQVAAADRIVADAEAVLERGRQEAQRILADAQARAEDLVAEHEITTASQHRAAEIEAAAKARADQLEADADEYCDSRLAQFETDLGAIQQQVEAGRARLAARRQSR